MHLKGNWPHVAERVQQRIDVEYRHLVDKMVAGGLEKMARLRKLPNRDWFKPIRNKKLIVGYICGQGCWVSTVYGPEMAPRGKEI